MRKFRHSPRCRAAIAAVLAAMLGGTAPAAHAEKADRDKPINWSTDAADVNYQTKGGTLTGNVVITQGTLTIRADRVIFRQNPDNSMSATAFGNPVAFRQKREGFDEYLEGFAQRAEFDGAKDMLELFDRALLRRGKDELRSNYVSYNTATEFFKAESRAGKDAAPDDAVAGARVRGVFQPKADAAAGKSPAGDAGSAAKDAAPDPNAVPLRPAGTLEPRGPGAQ